MSHHLDFLNITIPPLNTTTLYNTTNTHHLNTTNTYHPNTTTIFTTSDEHRCKDFIVIVNVFIFVGLGIFGIIGNLLTFLVLRFDGRHHVACFLLQTLALNDASFLFLILFAQVIPSLTIYFEREDHPAKVLTYIFVYPLVYYTQLNTVWIKVFISFNRYVAICLPFKEATWNTSRRVKIQIVCLFVFVFIYTIPRFFEYKLHWGERMEAVLTDMKLSSTYQAIYETYSYCLVVYFGPLSLLLVLNGLLIKELLRSEKKMKSMQMSRQKSKITMHDKSKISFEKKLKKKFFEIPIGNCPTNNGKSPTAEILQLASPTHARITPNNETFMAREKGSGAIVDQFTTDSLEDIGGSAGFPGESGNHLTQLTNDDACYAFNPAYSKTSYVSKDLGETPPFRTKIKECLNLSNSLNFESFSVDIKEKNLSLYYRQIVPTKILKKFASAENFQFDMPNTINTSNENSIYKKETLKVLEKNEPTISNKKNEANVLKIPESNYIKQNGQRKLSKSKQIMNDENIQLVSQTPDKDTNITLVMVAIVVVFVVCQTPGYINQVLSYVGCEYVCGGAYFYYYHFSNLIISTNSVFNFIIYCLLRKKFRQKCWRLFSK